MFLCSLILYLCITLFLSLSEVLKSPFMHCPSCLYVLIWLKSFTVPAPTNFGEMPCLCYFSQGWDKIFDIQSEARKGLSQLTACGGFSSWLLTPRQNGRGRNRGDTVHSRAGRGDGDRQHAAKLCRSRSGLLSLLSAMCTLGVGGADTQGSCPLPALRTVPASQRTDILITTLDSSIAHASPLHTS